MAVASGTSALSTYYRHPVVTIRHQKQRQKAKANQTANVPLFYSSKRLTMLNHRIEWFSANYASDWHHGETLIRDSYFVTYAQELADDIGAIKKDAGWPNPVSTENRQRRSFNRTTER